MKTTETNYIDEVLEELQKKLDKSDDWNCGITDIEIFEFVKQKLKETQQKTKQDLEKTYKSARRTYLSGYEDGVEKTKQEIKEMIMEEVRNADLEVKMSKSSMIIGNILHKI